MRYRGAPPAGTLDALRLLYLDSPRVIQWAPTTREKFGAILLRYVRANSGMRVADVTRGDIIRARDSMARTPGKANNWLKVIRGLFGYAVDLEWIAVNPARDVPPLAMDPEGHRTWTEAEIAAYLDRWPAGTLQRRVFVLALYTGAARADLVRLGWQSLTADGAALEYRRAKMLTRGGPLVTVPILPELRAELAGVPRSQMTFLESRDGRARSEKGLTGDFGRWCAAAGVHDVSLHGLRKALGRRLAEAGCTPHEIMAILGHTTIKEAARYSAAYNRRTAAASAMERLANAPAPNVVRIGRKPAPDQ
jgi:integrase